MVVTLLVMLTTIHIKASQMRGYYNLSIKLIFQVTALTIHICEVCSSVIAIDAIR